jgi:vacuolar-type H+-ATPase subunit H
MAISAERFKFLDKETNAAIKSFIEVTDNAIYNEVDKVTNTVLDAKQEAEKIVSKVGEELESLREELLSNIENNEIVQELKSTLDNVVDDILNMDMPDIVKDMAGELKKLDLPGVKGFFKDALNIGKGFLCNNLDFLKMFSFGFNLSGNILHGLLMGLTFDWLDRFCKAFTPEEILKGSPKDILSSMFPFNGVKLNADNVLGEFTKLYGDFVKNGSPFTTPTALTQGDFIVGVLAGDVDNSVNNLKQAEIDSIARKSYLSSIENELTVYTPGSIEHQRLLEARAKLSKAPLINSTRRTKRLQYTNLTSNLGLFAKNLIKLEVKKPAYSLSTLDSGLFDKLLIFKDTISSNSALKATDRKGLSSFDIGPLLPTLNATETTYLENKKESSNSHRLFNLHPTSVTLAGV